MVMGNFGDGAGREVLVSIILLTKNGEENIRSRLDGLYRQRMIGSAEVIVIDSGSSDGTLDIVAAYPVA